MGSGIPFYHLIKNPFPNPGSLNRAPLLRPSCLQGKDGRKLSPLPPLPGAQAGLGLCGHAGCHLHWGQSQNCEPRTESKEHDVSGHWSRAQGQGQVIGPRPERGDWGGFILQGLLLPHTPRPGCSVRTAAWVGLESPKIRGGGPGSLRPGAGQELLGHANSWND